MFSRFQTSTYANKIHTITKFYNVKTIFEMTQVGLVLFTLVTTCICLLAFGAFSAKSFVWKARGEEATFPGAGLFYGSPAQVTEKYELSIYPAPWAISIIWPVVLFWNIAAMVYLFYGNLTATPLHLPQKTFYLWSGAWWLTTVWTFLFDAESHIGALLSVLFVMIFSVINLGIGCQYFHLYEKQLSKDDKTNTALNHPFRFLVVESFAIISTWSIVAFGISIGYALAYKNSLHSSEAILTGFLTPEESASMGAIWVMLCFAVWWTLDVAYWGNVTDCIRSIYPAFVLIMLSLGLSNYSTERGMTLNNVLCFGSSVMSLVAMVTRNRAKEMFLRSRFNPDVVRNGFHRD